MRVAGAPYYSEVSDATPVVKGREQKDVLEAFGAEFNVTSVVTIEI